jgi:hypothetical protein
MRRMPFLVLLFFLPTLVLANGSPINTGEIERTGNIQMIQKKDIRLLFETVSVRLLGDYADVRVRYSFHNTGPSDKVTYGFPIECAPYTGEAFAPKEEALTNFRIEAQNNFDTGRRQLPILETQVKKSDPENEFSPYWKWHIVEIPFAENEHQDVFVSYRVKSSLADYVYTKSFRPEFSSRTFRYALNPAKNWGNGLVQYCQIQIDTREFAKYGAVVSAISPKGYSVKGGVISWTLEDLDFSKAEDIEVVYDNSSAEFTRYVTEYRVPSKEIAARRASSVLKTDAINRYGYGPEKLFDGDLNTAWSEGAAGDGVGEWVEVEFVASRASRGLVAIGIVNGYTKNETLYLANNRIRKIRLDIEYGQGLNRISHPETMEVELTGKQFNDLNRNAEGPFISWLADFGMGEEVKKIRLTILEVAPGDKFNDTCIAELYLLGW